jgi:hypothetical protein
MKNIILTLISFAFIYLLFAFIMWDLCWVTIEVEGKRMWLLRPTYLCVVVIFIYGYKLMSLK